MKNKIVFIFLILFLIILTSCSQPDLKSSSNSSNNQPNDPLPVTTELKVFELYCITLPSDNTPTFIWYNPDGATSIRYSIDDEINWTEIGLVTTLTHTTSLANGMHKIYIQCFDNMQWYSSFSIDFYIDYNVIVHNPPTNLVVSQTIGNTPIINLNWDAISNVYYRVYRSTDNITYTCITPGGLYLTTNSYIDTNINFDIQYYYKVTAIYLADSTESDKSSSVNKTCSRIIDSFYLPNCETPAGIVSDGNYLWVSVRTNGKIYKILKSNYSVVFTISTGIFNTYGLAVDSNYIYAANETSNVMKIYNKSTGALASARVLPISTPRGMDFVGTNLYITDFTNSNTIYVYDVANSLLLTTYNVPSKATGISYYNGKIYMSAIINNIKVYKMEIDCIVNNSINEPIQDTFDLAVDENYMWMTDYQTYKVYKVSYHGL